MVTIFIHRADRTEQVTSIERVWLAANSGVTLWVDLAAPSIPDQINQLAQLRDQGHITADEFEAKKAQLLERM